MTPTPRAQAESTSARSRAHQDHTSSATLRRHASPRSAHAYAACSIWAADSTVRKLTLQRRHSPLDAHRRSLDAQAGVAAVRTTTPLHPPCRAPQPHSRHPAGRLPRSSAAHAALGQENFAPIVLQGQGPRRRRPPASSRSTRLNRLGDRAWRAAQAATVDSPEPLLARRRDIAGRVALIAREPGIVEAVADSLASRVRGPRAAVRLLATIRTTESLDTARALLDALRPGESVITRTGEWLGQGWVRVIRSGEAQQGTLAREREIQSLRGEIDRLARREAEINEQVAGLKDLCSKPISKRETPAYRSISPRGWRLPPVAATRAARSAQTASRASTRTRATRFPSKIAAACASARFAETRRPDGASSGAPTSPHAASSMNSRASATPSRRAFQSHIRWRARPAHAGAGADAGAGTEGPQRAQLDLRKSELASPLVDGTPRSIARHRTPATSTARARGKGPAAARSGLEVVESELAATTQRQKPTTRRSRCANHHRAASRAASR